LLCLCGMLCFEQVWGQGIDVQDQRGQRQPIVDDRAANQERRLVQLARRYEELADFRRALDTYRQLAKKQPNNPAYYQGMLRNMLYLKEYEQALALIDSRKPQGMRRNPADPLSVFQLEVDRGEVLYKMGEADSAFAVWHRALDEVGFDANAYSKVVRTMMSNRLMDEAAAVIKDARRKGAGPGFMAYDMAVMRRAQWDYGEAAREFLRAYQHSPARFGMVQRELTRFPASGEVVDSVVAAFREFLPQDEKQAIRKLLIGFLLKSQRYDEALAETLVLDSLSQKSGQEAFEFAQQFLREKQVTPARVLFQEVVANDRVDQSLKTAARLGLARCLEHEGSSAEALVQFEELAKLGLRRPEGREARFRAGMVRLRDLGDPGGARLDFQELLSAGIQKIGDHEVGLWLGDCNVMAGDLEAARQSYQAAVDRKRGRKETAPAVLRMRLARVALWGGEIQPAAEILDVVVKGRRDDEAVNDALQWSLFLSQARSDSLALLKFARGDLAAFQGYHEQAVAVFQEAKVAARDGRVAEESLLRMSLELRAMGRAEAAVDSLREFMALYPTSVQREDVMFLLGDILENDLGDIPAAIEQYEKLLIESPGGMHMEEARRRIRQLEMYKQS
jgi:tetratricopeptide (TPR) repeat protein